MPHDIFVSYASADKAIADAICAALESQKIRCWIAPRDFPAGSTFPEAIVRAIEDCRGLVIVFSSNANKSQQINREVERAVSKGKFIVPFRIEDVLPSGGMEYYIGNTHWLDALSQPIDLHVTNLVKYMKVFLQQQPGTAESPSRKEQSISKPSPFEVFISFKNLDETGNPTRDQTIAQQVTHALMKRGISVFFSVETLERLGTSAYKKAIDNALDEAKVLIAVGTSKANLESEWVRYEWDGFLQDVISGVKPTGHVFVVTEGISPRDLPRGLRHSQTFTFSEPEIERMINFIRHAMG